MAFTRNPLRDWFKWNGVSCKTYGITVLDNPELVIPEMRATFTDVPGRTGSLVTIEGEDIYKDINYTVNCTVSDTTLMQAIARWLCGGVGQIEFSNRPYGYYEAILINPTVLQKVMRGHENKTFKLVFRCKPFFIRNDTTHHVTAQRGGGIQYNGTVFGLPKITITAANSTTPVTTRLTLGTTAVDISNMVGGIVIDSRYQEAYYQNASKNSLISCGEFPKLYSGSVVNTINWTNPGSISSVVLDFEERYL